MDWRVASSRVEWIHSNAIISGRVVPGSPEPAPAGVQHAYLEGASEAACGEPLGDLNVLPDYEWSPIAYGEMCEACKKAIVR
jgi:hypothetical protein